MSRPPALTLWRPWPSLMVHAGKNVENRVWKTFYRGPLLIHAAKGTDLTAMRFAHELSQLRITPPTVMRLDQVKPDPADHPLGIVAVAELYDICDYSMTHRGMHCPTCPLWALPNNYHWRIRNVVEFPKPVGHSGAQRLWAVKDRHWADVHAQLKAVGCA